MRVITWSLQAVKSILSFEWNLSFTFYIQSIRLALKRTMRQKRVSISPPGKISRVQSYLFFGSHKPVWPIQAPESPGAKDDLSGFVWKQKGARLFWRSIKRVTATEVSVVYDCVLWTIHSKSHDASKDSVSSDPLRGRVQCQPGTCPKGNPPPVILSTGKPLGCSPSVVIHRVWIKWVLADTDLTGRVEGHLAFTWRVHLPVHALTLQNCNTIVPSDGKSCLLKPSSPLLIKRATREREKKGFFFSNGDKLCWMDTVWCHSTFF